MRAHLPRACGVGALALACVWTMTGAAFAQRYDPSLAFETLETAHFRIHFHGGERPLAERLAPIAEGIYERARSTFRGVPGGRTHVILSGQDDLPNGWATPFPLNVIELRTTWPRPSSTLGHSDDWLRLVFAHEFTHILHLDRSRGLMHAARYVFGRAPFVMPNLFLPTWQVEGIATWQESAVTGEGRVRDGTSRRVASAAASAGRVPGLDRVSGGLVSWPAGDGPYVYGGLFHDYLANRFGSDAIDRWTDATAAWPPLLGFLAFGRTFETSVGTAWRDFSSTLAGQQSSAGDRAVRVTTDGFAPGLPRWDRSRPGSVLYTRVTPDAFPALMRVDVSTREPVRVAWRFLGEGLGAVDGRVVFDQLDLAGSVALQADLYELDLASGRTRRLTHGERAGDPDISADGRRLAYVVGDADRRRLVVKDLDAIESAAPRDLVSEPGVYMSGPRWSPSGREIVAERVRAGASPEVVLVDVQTGALEPLVPGVGARQATPTWTPDGVYIVMAVADGPSPFRLVAVSRVDRQIWDVLAPTFGARAPDISPDGTRVAYLGFSAEGEDVFVAPFDRTAWTARVPTRPEATAREVSAASVGSTVKAYSPVGALVPRYWSPLVRVDDDVLEVGGETSASDPLGRHSWSLAAWRRSDTGRGDWTTAYVYSRWRPTVFAAAAGEHRVFTDVRETTRSFSVGVAVPFARVRRSQQVFASLQLEHLSALAGSGASASVDRHALRAGWAFSSARTFGYSISPEEGARLGVTSEHVMPALGATARADALVAEARVYQRAGFDHGVVAVRAAGAVARGDRLVRRRFGAGCRTSATSLSDIGGDAVALMRGVATTCAFATRAGVVNVDYRLPVWRVERGVGVYPGFLRWLHAGVFTDAGDEWNAGEDPRWKLSAGLELSADVVVGHSMPLTLATGVAWVRDGANVLSGPRAYVRIGRAF